MCINNSKFLCILILASFFVAGAVFIGQIQAALIPTQDKKDDGKKEDKSFDQFQTEIIKLLKNLDPNPKDKEEYTKTVRKDLYKIVDKYSVDLRPEMGSKKYISADKAFVLVIGANRTTAVKKPMDRADSIAEAIDDEAKIVVAIAGDGDSERLSGGGAIAKAKRGVAVALGGGPIP